METIPNKMTSLRCDMHPPLSALAYCERCDAFLCRICAEIKPGGRVCVKCKNSVREFAPSDIPALLERRKLATDKVRQAKEAEERARRAQEQAKADRDARAKAEFAARKAEWQRQDAEKKIATGSNRLPAQVAPLVPGTNAVPPLPPPGAGGPGKFDDPLYKLGERSHIAVINKARNKILLVAILSMFFNGVAYLLLAGVGTMADGLGAVAEEINAKAEADALKSEKKMTAEERRIAKEEREERRDKARKIREAALSRLFWIKVILFFFFAVGLALFVLYFMCESQPREATAWAFYLYTGCTVVGLMLDMVLTGEIPLLSIAIRASFAYALYLGMLAGAKLQQMRDDEAQWLASKQA